MAEPTRRTHRRRPNWPAVFIDVIGDTGNVRLAAEAAGVDRTTPYALARRDPAFASAWADAEQQAVDLLEAEARRRALVGSDALLAFLLRGLRPERFGQTLAVSVDLRREAERIAAKTGRSADEILEAAERRAAELGRR